MASATDIGLMRVAIAEARIGQSEGEPPFGAVVADGSRTVVARAHDTVVGSGDMTRHSEVDAVRAACAKVGPDLSGHTLYATTEPCAMCFTAAWLARISRIVYGCTMAEVASIVPAQREVTVPVTTMNASTVEPLALEGGVLGAECLEMFR